MWCVILVTGFVHAQTADQNETTGYEAFVEQFTEGHFSETLVDLLEKESLHGASKVNEDLFGLRIASVRDARANAQALGKHLSTVSEFHAGRKHELLRALLVAKGIVSESDLQKVIGLGGRVVAGHFYEQIAQLNDDNAVKRTFGPATSSLRRQFRSLLLGLNALLVAKLQSTSQKATFRLNHLAAVDPAEMFGFKGLLPRPFVDPPATTESPTNEPVSTESPTAAEPTPDERRRRQLQLSLIHI